MKTRFFFTILLACTFIGLYSQAEYHININQPEKEITRGHLDLGGMNPSGDEINVNSYYIELNGEPFFPVIGEFHYSRYPNEFWEESIQKMKAGGINVIATYVFWNLHEREEGKFDWSKDLNLRKFVELVRANDLYAIVRIGPFCHGEMRNGGLPDWIYGRTFEVRSNQPAYLEYVDRLYNETGKQLNGLLFKDGGPVIGIQLENEYQHSAAPWEFNYPDGHKELTVADWQSALAHEQIEATDGVNPWSAYGIEHMSILRDLAEKNGMDVPLYTATGWRNAAIVEKGSIPVTAGYAYPFWAPPVPTPFFLFKDIHENPDYSPVSYEPALYPSVAAEIGPGIQVKYIRRPVIDYRFVSPLMTRIVGSGSNGIGYYMYHGGTTPTFEGKYYNEEQNGLPRKNYDFQAPIGQYGQIRYHYKNLRLLHMFLQSWSDVLAPMKTILPETNNSIIPSDSTTLRYAVRSSGDVGFVFIINFQDHMDIADIRDVSISVEGKEQDFRFPSTGNMDIPKFTAAIFPFNLTTGRAKILSATVQPLTILQVEGEECFVFSSIDGIEPELLFVKGTSISEAQHVSRMKQASGVLVKGSYTGPFSFKANGTTILVLPQEMAMNTVRNGNSLYISDGLILPGEKGLSFISREETSTVHIFPSPGKALSGESVEVNKITAPLKEFSSYRIEFPAVSPLVKIEKASDRKYSLKLESDISALNDLIVEVNYTGDRALAFINGELVNDHFYHERPWELSMRQMKDWILGEEMVLVFHPMYSDASYLIDFQNIPDFTNNRYLDVREFRIIPEYKTSLRLE